MLKSEKEQKLKRKNKRENIRRVNRVDDSFFRK